MKGNSLFPWSMSEFDRYLFHEGTHYDSYLRFGAHPVTFHDTVGTAFTLWAPHANRVSVLTARTNWDETSGRMIRSADGIWEVFLPGVMPGDVYRYAVTDENGVTRYKSDPYAFGTEMRPQNGSVVRALDAYTWHDADYMASRPGNHAALAQPMAIYELHLGSWKKQYQSADDPDGFLNYRELACQIADYTVYMGYTHVELIGICEHPFDGSWGYQVTGFFSPTSRHGTADDFRFFVDTLHQRGIGVILDWVPAHFPRDSFGLSDFDGTKLYEYEDPLRGEFPEWGTLAFDHGKPEVRSFLISSAFYWIREFHVDALRVDAVASMLYNSFGRKEWRPNKYGDHLNLEGRAFLCQLNGAVLEKTDAYLIAEDSSILPDITKHPRDGGLGFLLKWDMGWMNETLRYFALDPVYRKWHHDLLVHSMDYAGTEHFVLPLSHDEVVHLKHSMVEKAHGALPDRLGALKTLYTWQFTRPGKKLLFMGQDFAACEEWNENKQINWGLADDFGHRDVMLCVKKLLEIYRRYPVLHNDEGASGTFEWINGGDAPRNIISFIRRNPWNFHSAVLVICNFSPVAYPDYTVGVPVAGLYARVFSSYDTLPGGGSPEETSVPPLSVHRQPCDGRPYRINYSLRAYESVILELPIRKQTTRKKATVADKTAK